MDFGEVWETDRFDWTLHVANSGAEKVDITSWQASCDCQKVHPPKVTLAPGEVIPVRMTVDLRPRPNDPPSTQARKVAFRLSPRYEAGKANDPADDWKICGTVKPFYRLLDLDRPSMWSELSQSHAAQRVGIQFMVPVGAVTVRAEPPLDRAAVVRNRGEDAPYEIEYRWSNQIPVGSYTPNIYVQPRLADDSPLPVIRITRQLDVVEDVGLSPPRVTLPLGSEERWSEETVRVYSRSGRPVRVLDVEGRRDELHSVEGRDDYVRVRVRGPNRGTLQWTIYIRVASGDKVYRLPLEVIIG